MLSPEQLSVEEKKILEQYLQKSSQAGAVIGVLRGKGVFDLRPILLQDQNMRLLRFSDPLLFQQKELFNRFRANQLRLLNLHGIDPAIDTGEADRQMWCRRSYWKSLLPEYLGNLRIRDASSQKKFFRELLIQLQEAHSQGMFHGHIVSENIGIGLGESPYLSDFGFAVFQRSSPDGEDFFQKDVQDLCRVGAQCLSDSNVELEREYLSSIAAGKSQDTLDVICERFHVEKVSLPEFSSAENAGKATWHVVRSGKFIRPVLSEATSRAQVQKIQNLLSPKSEKIKQKTSQKPGRVGFILSLLLVTSIAALFVSNIDRFGWFHDKTISFQEYWNSGDPGKQKQVVESAVLENSLDAARVILGSAQKGSGLDSRSLSFLQFVTRKDWFYSLGIDDLRFAIRIAFARLLPEQVSGLAEFSELHPAVQIGLLGFLKENTGKGVRSVSVEQGALLPDPIGSAFRYLQGQGVKTFTSPQALALAQIVVGNAKEQDIHQYLNGFKFFSKQQVYTILPFVKNSPEILSLIGSILEQDFSGELADYLRWFEQSPVDGWKSVSIENKLALLLEGWGSDKYSLEQLADLLRYPSPSVRENAVQTLVAQEYTKKDERVIQFLASDAHRFTREQVIGLLLAKKLSGSSERAYVSQWFASEPDPEMVLRLILLQSESSGAFHILAARYLSERDWKISLEELSVMVNHKEPLVRALGYTRLNAKNPVHKRILQERLSKEKLEHFREDIERRLREG